MSKAKILVVEDEPLVGMEIQESLIAMGYDVPQVIDSGDAILESSLRLKPDLILMDIHLKSFIDGIDAARRIRMFSEVPIIYMTGYTSEEIRERAELTNPEDYLIKPFDEATLKDHVSKVLAKREKKTE